MKQSVYEKQAHKQAEKGSQVGRPEGEWGEKSIKINYPGNLQHTRNFDEANGTERKAHTHCSMSVRDSTKSNSRVENLKIMLAPQSER